MITARNQSGSGLSDGLEATHLALEGAEVATAAAKVAPPRIAVPLPASERSGTHMACFIAVLDVHAPLLFRASSRQLNDF
jgi:hypothetical protein